MSAPDAQPVLRVVGLTKAYLDRRNRVNAVAGVDFEIRPGHFYTLLGPSGCGKTTTLRCVAGLERPDGGSVTVDGALMSEAGSRHFVPPYRRPMGMVFQNYAIWPHLSVFENVAFPLRVAGNRPSKAEIRRRVEESLAIVQLSDYIGRPATNLSGGQQQRLALARALVRDPKILLLDEPLSNLDARLRHAMRAELRALQRRIGVTTLYVTHDQAEALSMSNRIAVMADGRIVQEGTPREIYTAPKTRFVADFIGESNFLDGTVAGRAQDGRMTIRTPAGLLEAYCPAEVTVGDRVTLSIRPQDLTLNPAGAEPGNVLSGVVGQALFLGEHLDYLVRVGDVDLSLRQPAANALRRGAQVQVAVPSGRITVFSEQHGVAQAAPDREQEPTDVGDPAGDPAGDRAAGPVDPVAEQAEQAEPAEERREGQRT